MKWLVPGCIALSAIFTVPVFSAPQKDANYIIERSTEANERDWKAAPQYDYFERDREKDGGTKTFEELMILGSPYERLVAVNGKTLAPEQRAEEHQKLNAVMRERQNEPPQQRAQRITQYEKQRKRDRLLMEQMAKAFDFKLAGDQRLKDRQVYVLSAAPRPGYAPPNNEAKVLTGMKGTLWIDRQTFQWVKVEAQVVHPVSIAGFLARVEPGTRFELEKMPVEDGIWLPSHFAMTSKARVFFFFTRQRQEDETYFGYRKAAEVR